ncbi:LacI family DNA-binding transcriptional regulator [Bacillus sp. FJAT-28004]|uniref:LacI family DNA-binding transcriptional regulator n=1 Tax=Bacillus sp. FJAT-28004 TaxID=1679165 RepID=UPI0006B44CE9|nr:LacI family DNA-binding transcriptional regulator [Bacillus sp. FJAT-28004]
MSQERITIKDVAKRAKVSIATVSNVLNGTGRVAPNTIQLVRAAIEEMNFTPSMSARNLKDKKSSLIAVIVPFLEKGRLHDNPFYWQLVTGIEEGARNEKLHVLLVGVEPDENFSFVRERHLDGLIVIGVFEDSPIYERIQQLNVPCVFMDSYLKNDDLYQVGLDDELGGYIGTKHLLSLGHQNIALLTGALLKEGVNHRRWLGYKKALKEAGMNYHSDRVFEVPTSSIGGYRTASQIVSRGQDITAVFALSDVLAIGLIKGLHDLGIVVPRDVSVMGFDDNQNSRYMVPGLTTVHQDIVLKGQMAVKLLIAQMENEPEVDRKVVIGVELTIRQSTAEKK